MVARTLPGLGLTAFWPLADDTYKPKMDENLLRISALLGNSVASRTTDPLPGSPTTDLVYIVDAGDGTNPNKIAIWDGEVGSEQWNYFDPVEGMTFWVEDESANVQFDGTSWIGLAATSAVVMPAALTAAHTVTNFDLGGSIIRRVYVASDVDITVAAGLTGKQPCSFIQTGVGKLTFVEDTGVTILALNDDVMTAGQGAVAVLVPDADTADFYYLTGGLTT
tara:strand:- start:904 stop:1569 length:666 start_codon:yes stop_codon:yes gene_type:complete